MSDDQQQIKGFTFLPSFDKCFEAIRDNDALTLKFFHAIRDYWFRGVKPVFEGSEAFSWGQIEYLFEQSKETSKRRAEKKLGNKNALKPEITENNRNNTIQQKQPETTETTQNNKNNPFREEKRIEENRREEKSRVEERKVEESKDVSPSKTTPAEKKSPNRRPQTATVNGETTRRSHRTTTKTVAELMALYPDAMPFWERIQTPYPSFRCHTPGEGTLQFIEKERLWEREAEIVSAINNFNANDANWQAGRVWRLSKFIEERHWEHEPAKPIVETVRKIYTNQAPMPKYTDNSDIPQF